MSKSKMSKADLVARFVARGVAKWGEEERAGLLKQAEAKSLKALQAGEDAAALDDGAIDQAEYDRRSDARIAADPVKRYQSTGNFDDGGLT